METTRSAEPARGRRRSFEAKGGASNTGHRTGASSIGVDALMTVLDPRGNSEAGVTEQRGPERARTPLRYGKQQSSSRRPIRQAAVNEHGGSPLLPRGSDRPPQRLCVAPRSCFIPAQRQSYLRPARPGDSRYGRISAVSAGSDTARDFPDSSNATMPWATTCPLAMPSKAAAPARRRPVAASWGETRRERQILA